VSAPPHLVLRSRRVVLPGGLGPASVELRDGVVAAVREHEAPAPAGAQEIELGSLVVSPGLLDTHVHINEPGRTEWEGFATATRAAAAGGVTTLVEMPLNADPPTTAVAALQAKLEAAAAAPLRADVGFWGGIVPGNTGEITPLWEAGVFGFKCFLAPSGIDSFGHVGEDHLRLALPILAELGAPLLVHAEDPGVLARAAAAAAGLDPRAYATYVATRPPEAEVEAIRMLVRLCREFGARVHVVHLAAAEALPLLRQARAEGLPLSVESCPHYLRFAAEEIPDGATEFKCAPPLRGRENRDALWRALGAGEIDLVASDHSPCLPAMKGREGGDFMAAWGGIAGLQLSLPALWEGARERGHTPVELARWTATEPARLAGLDAHKGEIVPGGDADLVVWDPEGEFLVEPRGVHHRHAATPYLGSILPGVVETTYLRGTPVFRRGEEWPPAAGRILLRGQQR
jgi:allantoinase